MLRALAVTIGVGLLLYCFIDALQADPARVRNLPRMLWLLVIVAVPVFGPLAWLFLGRPLWQAPWHTAPPRRRGPDDDPDFLASLRPNDPTREQKLAQWEAELRERERRLGDNPDDETPSSRR
ncbi:MAG: PLD nuclease N-terminal domain-containing protein [Micrococcales bacterium]|nr:PLD nuclease N-terminal domain-containing protein [Micrococcales bacterium]MCL2667594.1 PLD nuclease N-terminal domain-containing protein [Micrococcales bacterium]